MSEGWLPVNGGVVQGGRLSRGGSRGVLRGGQHAGRRVGQGAQTQCAVRLPLQSQPRDLPQLLTFGAAGCQKTSRLLIGFLSEVNQIKIKYQVNQGKKAQIKLTVKINTIRQLIKENLIPEL